MTKLESATLIITVSTRLDGASIERRMLERSIWINDRLLHFLALVLIVAEAFVMTCGDVWFTINYYTTCAVSDYLSLYFVGQCWRWLLCD